MAPPQSHSTESIQEENEKQEEDGAHILLIQLWRHDVGWAGEDCSTTAQGCWGEWEQAGGIPQGCSSGISYTHDRETSM